MATNRNYGAAHAATADTIAAAIARVREGASGIVKADNKEATASLASIVREQGMLLAQAGYAPDEVRARAAGAFAGEKGGTARRYCLALADVVFLVAEGLPMQEPDGTAYSIPKIEAAVSCALDSGLAAAMEQAASIAGLVRKLAAHSAGRRELAALVSATLAAAARHGIKGPSKRKGRLVPQPDAVASPAPAPLRDATEVEVTEAAA